MDVLVVVVSDENGLHPLTEESWIQGRIAVFVDSQPMHESVGFILATSCDHGTVEFTLFQRTKDFVARSVFRTKSFRIEHRDA